MSPAGPRPARPPVTGRLLELSSVAVGNAMMPGLASANTTWRPVGDA